MNAIKHAVIAAAGLGSRLHQGLPKCLTEVNGHKIIEYQLAQLKSIPDVRIVIGYHADEVIRFVHNLRPDIRFVLNKDFATTTTLQSYYIGCHDIHDYFILLDGDIIPHKSSFRQLCSKFSGESLIGVSPAYTQDSVFVHINGQKQIVEFTRTEESPYEWSNIAIVHSDLLSNESIYVYQCFEKHLPILAEPVERLEIDTCSDMEYALKAMSETSEYSL